MAKIIRILILLGFLLTGCSKSYDPILALPSGAYVAKSGLPVEVITDATSAKIIIAIWFSTSCSHCRNEITEFRDNYDIIKSNGIEIVGLPISMPREDILAFAREMKLEFPLIARIQHSPNGFVPYTMLIIRDKVVAEWAGRVSVETVLERAGF